MKPDIRSFPRWVGDRPDWTAYISNTIKGHQTRADLIVREPETQDVDCPPVNTKMKGRYGGPVTVRSGPEWEPTTKRVVVLVQDERGAVYAVYLDELTPVPETRRYRVEVDAVDEDDARAKLLDGDVRLERIDDE